MKLEKTLWIDAQMRRRVCRLLYVMKSPFCCECGLFAFHVGPCATLWRKLSFCVYTMLHVIGPCQLDQRCVDAAGRDIIIWMNECEKAATFERLLNWMSRVLRWTRNARSTNQIYECREKFGYPYYAWELISPPVRYFFGEAKTKCPKQMPRRLSAHNSYEFEKRALSVTSCTLRAHNFANNFVKIQRMRCPE